MFKELFASLSIFFASLFTNQTDLAQTQPVTLVQQAEKSYFKYITATEIAATAYFGDRFQGIDTPQAKRKFILVSAEFEIPGCKVLNQDDYKNIDITDKQYYDFILKLDRQCLISSFDGRFVVKQINSVTVDGKEFESYKIIEENIRFHLIDNSLPVSSSSYSIELKSKDGNMTLYKNSQKEFIYIVKDKTGNEVSNEMVEEVKIETLNPSVIQFLKDGFSVDELVFNNQNGAVFIVKAGDKTGTANIVISVKLKDDKGFVVNKSQNFILSVVEKPVTTVEQQSYNVTFTPDDNSYFLLPNSVKKIKYKITDSDDNQVADSDILWIRVRTLDGEIFQIEKDGKLFNELKLENNLSALGEIYVASFNKNGSASLLFEAAINDDEKGSVIVENKIPITVEGIPSFNYSAVLIPQSDKLIVDKGSYIQYKIIYLSNGELVDEGLIEKVELSIEDDNSYFLNGGKQLKSVEFSSNVGHMYIVGYKPGFTKVTVSVSLKDGKKISQSMVLAVANEDNRKIGIEYVGTEYLDDIGLFVDTYTIYTDLDNDFIDVGIVTPHIEYPQLYYKAILSWVNKYHSKYVYYQDIYFNDYGFGQLYKNGNLIFSNELFDLTKIVPYDNKLVILPNKYRNSYDYLGGWDIVEVLNTKEMVVSGNINKEKIDYLSFVIGNNKRYNPVQDTIAMMYLDRKDGVYKLSNGLTNVKIYYPNFFAGKDIFIYANYKDISGYRVGNSFKRTLTGLGLQLTEIGPCKSELCVKKVKAYFDVNNKPLQYSNFAIKCKSNKLRKPIKIMSTYEYIELNSVNDGLLYQNPCEQSNAITSQITDGNGEFIMCIFPEGTEQKDEETNTTKITYNADDIQCEIQVAEEFSK